METLKSEIGFRIGVTCPGCGGELELGEDFFCLQCAHCGSVLRVVPPGGSPIYLVRSKIAAREARIRIDRYLKNEELPLTRSDFRMRPAYYPYWRVSAIRLQLRREIIRKTNSSDDANLGNYSGLGDLSIGFPSMAQEPLAAEDKWQASFAPYVMTTKGAAEFPGIPLSLGLRTEYVRAIPFSSDQVDTGDLVFPVTMTWDRVLADLNRSIVSKRELYGLTGGGGHYRLYDVNGAIFYFPYFLAFSDTASENDYFVVDRVSGRIVHVGPHVDEDSFIPDGADSLQTFEPLRVEFHRCPNCGIDLPAISSAVYMCNNCHHVVMLEDGEYLRDGISAIAADKPYEGNLFPFWAFTLLPEEVGRIASPAVGRVRPERLLVPAFKMANFEALRRLCQRTTNQIAPLPLQQVDRQDSRFLPVETGSQRALALAQMIRDRQELIKNPSAGIAEKRLHPRSTGLVYIPFHPTSYFYVDGATGELTFEMSAIGR